MWILHFIPDSILLMAIYGLLMVGVAAVIAGLFLDFIPMIYLWKGPLLIVGVLMLGSGAYFYGGYGVEQEWRARTAELEKKAADAEKKSQVVRKQIQTKIVTKVKIVKEQVAANQEKIVEHQVEINAGCRLSDAAVNAYNELTKNKIVEEVHIHE